MYIYARPFLSMRKLSFLPICQLKRRQLCYFFNVWSRIILHLPYTTLTSCNLWFWAGWLADPIPARLPVFFCRCAFKHRSVVCFCFYVLFLWTWRYPSIDGNNWGAVHFNECAPSRWAGAAGSQRANPHTRLAYCTYERTPCPWSLETANESLKNPHGTSRFSESHE